MKATDHRNATKDSGYENSPLGDRGNSREQILSEVKNNQPEAVALPDIYAFEQPYKNVVEKYIEVLRAIGGEVHLVNDYAQIITIIKGRFHEAKRILSTCQELSAIAETDIVYNDPHELADVDLFITTTRIAVAENGAVWIADSELPERVLPFITQQLIVIVPKENIVATMYEAYEKIGAADYGFATFIAGPSKTADIEQSLVLGAHGPKGMTAFIL